MICQVIPTRQKMRLKCQNHELLRGRYFGRPSTFHEIKCMLSRKRSKVAITQIFLKVELSYQWELLSISEEILLTL